MSGTSAPDAHSDGTRRVRRDADRSRALILGSARTLLEADADATMHAIARSAGVGQATLYRHFATREALIMTVHRSDVRELVAAAPVLADQQDPVDALRSWFDRLAYYGRIKRGLAGALHTAMHARLADEGYGPIVAAIDHLLDAGRRDHSFRDDVTAEEVLLMVGFLWRLDVDDEWEQRRSRMIDVVMVGLRAG